MMIAMTQAENGLSMKNPRHGSVTPDPGSLLGHRLLLYFHRSTGLHFWKQDMTIWSPGFSRCCDPAIAGTVRWLPDGEQSLPPSTIQTEASPLALRITALCANEDSVLGKRPAAVQPQRRGPAEAFSGLENEIRSVTMPVVGSTLGSAAFRSPFTG